MERRFITSRESLYLDLVKALMLVQVIFGHAVALSVPKFAELDLANPSELVLVAIRSLTGFGRESAFQFIFLSGFFCAKEIFPSEKKFSFTKAFVWRIGRLYPVFIFALMLTLVVDYFGAFVFNFYVYQENGLHYKFSDHWGLLVFISNVFSLQPTAADTFGTNGPLWTLGYLIQFFIIAAVTRYFSGDRIEKFFTLSVIAALACVPVSGWEPSLLYIVWCLGVCAWQFSTVIPQWVRWRWIFLSTLLLFFVARLSPLFWSVCLTPFIGYGLLELCKRATIELPNSIIKPIRRVAVVNYAAYAIHMPILFFVTGLYGFNGSPGLDASVATIVLYFSVIFFVVFVCAWITQRFIDRIVSK